MTPPHNLDDLSLADIKVLALELLAQVAALKEVVAQQRAEIARLKGLKGPPAIKPSGMEKASETKPSSGGRKKRRGRGRQRVRVAIEERVVKAAVPAGSRFKILWGVGLATDALTEWVATTHPGDDHARSSASSSCQS